MTEIKPSGTWAGHPFYDCPHDGCAFDSLSESDYRDHLRIVHKDQEPEPSAEDTRLALLYEVFSGLASAVARTKAGRSLLIKEGYATEGKDGALWLAPLGPNGEPTQVDVTDNETE